MFAGVTVVTWYPITPSSSLVETLIGYMKRCRIDPATGKATYAVVQAEDELAAIGMVIGAGWAGARAMTATSGPGISLMSEFVGLAYYAEIPAVIWDVQSVGPSTGLPTRTQQCDILKNALLSHGDAQHPMLLPVLARRVFRVWRSTRFDLAEQFQTPVFVNTDLDLGMNNWMSEPFDYPESRSQRGKVLTQEDLDRLGGFARYKDVDGDGVGYRTLPGTDASRRGVLHARQRPQREGAATPSGPTITSTTWTGWRTSSNRCARPCPRRSWSGRQARIGMICFGTSRVRRAGKPRPAARRVRHRDQLPAPAAYPFTTRTGRSSSPPRARLRRGPEPRRAAARPDAPGSRPELIAKLRSVRYYGGLPLDARTVTDEMLSQEALMSTTQTPPPKNQPRRPGGHQLPRLQDHAVRGLRPQLHLRAIDRMLLRDGHRALARGQVLRHRLLVEVARRTSWACAHGFNGVHGRAPAIATGAMLANKNLLGIVVTGDGDTASIGIGQFIHMLRRNVPLIYIIENNGVYGLTKGQFSATSDAGAKSKSGVINELQPIDCCVEAIQIGATFVARSFSGDKRQLQAILKAAIAHRGLSVIDVISPCVTFNDHEGSTKSYSFMKDHDEPLQELDFVPFFADIEVEIEEGAVQDIEMHDGSRLRLHKLEHDYDPTDRLKALSIIQASKEASEVLTGVLYLDTAREISWRC